MLPRHFRRNGLEKESCKLQNPSSREIPTTKPKNNCARRLNFESLVLLWCLELGCWSFFQRVSWRKGFMGNHVGGSSKSSAISEKLAVPVVPSLWMTTDAAA